MMKKETPAIEDRKQRMVMANRILIARKKTDYKKAVALISYNLGISDRKAKEYIDTLLMVDGIKLVDGNVVKRK